MFALLASPSEADEADMIGSADAAEDPEAMCYAGAEMLDIVGGAGQEVIGPPQLAVQARQFQRWYCRYTAGSGIGCRWPND